jgi:hypothetical protein
MLSGIPVQVAARWIASLMSLAVLPQTLLSATPRHAAEAAEFEFRVNGVPLHARSLRVSLPQQTLAEALLREWGNAAAGPPLHVETSQRTILGRQVGFLHETVTLKAIDAQHTEVHMAVRDLRRPVVPQPRLPFVLPRSFTLLSVVEQSAASPLAQTFSLAARGEMSSVVKAIELALRAAGWSLSPAFRTQTQPGVVLWASRNDRQMQVVVVPNARGSTVIAQVSSHAP